MKQLTKEWMEELREYRQVGDLLREKGVEDLDAWRRKIERCASLAAARTAQVLQREGLDEEPDEWVGQTLVAADCRDGALYLQLDDRLLTLNGAVLTGEFPVDGESYVAAAELDYTAEHRLSLSLLLAHSDGKYSELSADGSRLQVNVVQAKG